MKLLLENEDEAEDIVRLGIRKVKDINGSAINIVRVDRDGCEIAKLIQINENGYFLFNDLLNKVPSIMLFSANLDRLQHTANCVGDSSNIPF